MHFFTISALLSFLIASGFRTCTATLNYPFDELRPPGVSTSYTVWIYLRSTFPNDHRFPYAYNHPVVGRLAKKIKKSELHPKINIEVIEATAYHNQSDFENDTNEVKVIFEHGDTHGSWLKCWERYLRTGEPRAETTIHFPEKSDKVAIKLAYLDFHPYDENHLHFYELLLLVEQAARTVDERLTYKNSAKFADVVMRMAALTKNKRDIWERDGPFLSIVGLGRTIFLPKAVSEVGIRSDLRPDFLKGCESMKDDATRYRIWKAERCKRYGNC